MKDSATFYADQGGADSTSIETVTGRFFDFRNPTFDIEEIAWALSMQCRFTGQIRRHYSVAEHCVLVSRLVDALKLGDPYEGLMHDAQEAYLSDVNAPAKGMIPQYRALESSIEAPLRRWAGLSGDKPSEGVKKADWLALYIEAWYLIPSRGDGRIWHAPPGIKEEARSLLHEWTIECMDHLAARSAFMDEYLRLRAAS